MKAFYYLDALLYAIPILIMIYLTVYMVVVGAAKTREVRDRLLVTKLIVLSDIAVKTAVYKEGDVAYINWIDGKKLSSISWADMGERIGVRDVYVGFSKGDGTCIYRVVAFGDEKEIRKLFVCGD